MAARIPWLDVACVTIGVGGCALLVELAQRWSRWRRRRRVGGGFHPILQPCERLLRVCVGHIIGPKDAIDELTCPLCLDLLLNPCRLQCGHHLCGECGVQLTGRRGRKSCPRCAARLIDERLLRPSPELEAQFDLIEVTCAGCRSWQGPLDMLWMHVVRECQRGNILMSIGWHLKADARILSLGDVTTPPEEKRVQWNLDRMRSSGGHFVGRFSAEEVGASCCSPVLSALNYQWVLSIERSGGEIRLMLAPFNGHDQRVRYYIIIAKPSGYESFYVSSWPSRCARMPWGYRLQQAIWQSFLQYDGSVLIMIHCVELIVGETEGTPAADKREAIGDAVED